MNFDELKRALRAPSNSHRPEVRWWLAEGFHTDETLRHEVDAAARFGFGGMEFLAMEEDDVDDTRYGWGSEEWAHDSEVVVAELTRRDMAVSFTSGANWANANLPHIDPEHPAAAKELNVAVETLRGGERRSGALSRVDPNAPTEPTMPPTERGTIADVSLVAVVAVRVTEETERGDTLDATTAADLTALVCDGALDWTAPGDGTWRLYSYWSHGTGQLASPSASRNYAVNYLDPEGSLAVIEYWDREILTPAVREQIARNPRVQMYMDSLELETYGAGGLLWGRTVPTEFGSRRGYDLHRWLPFLTRTAASMTAGMRYHNEPLPGQRVQVDKVRYDFVRTLTDLYIENMLRPLRAFLHENGIGLRAEISYGAPFELTRPGPEVDGIETESLEFGAQIDAYRLLAGPAHLFGKQYSSETGATTRNHMLEHRFYDQIIATQLAAGVTRTVLHGWASTAGAEAATAWPGHEGMWPMFSERFDTRQPGSEFYPLWTTALARQQMLLEHGVPRIDVGILRTDHFVDCWSGMVYHDDAGNRIPEEDAYARDGMRNRQNHWWQDLGMQDAGWTYEFFDGSLLLHEDVSFGEGLVQPQGPGYQALIVYQEALDPDVAALLLAWARGGLKLVIVHGARELKTLVDGEYAVHRRAALRTPGLDGRDEELRETIAALLELPTVTEIEDPAATIDALRALGVTGRAQFTADNPHVLSHMREDGDLTHLYLYHFRYDESEATEVEVALPGVGIAHRHDVWTGSTRRLRSHHDQGRTIVTVTLHPGETALLTLERNGAQAHVPSERTEVIAALREWDLTVESWDAGDTESITEDRGLGYVTREARPTTSIAPTSVASISLAPWSQIPEVGPEVSGVGEYRTTVHLEALPDDSSRLVLHLGSTAGCLGSVQVNASQAIGFDTSYPAIDVTPHLREGDNRITVRVASSLNNRLLARGYYDTVLDLATLVGGREPRTHETPVRPYGLLGPVTLVRQSADRETAPENRS